MSEKLPRVTATDGYPPSESRKKYLKDAGLTIEDLKLRGTRSSTYTTIEGAGKTQLDKISRRLYGSVIRGRGGKLEIAICDLKYQPWGQAISSLEFLLNRAFYRPYKKDCGFQKCTGLVTVHDPMNLADATGTRIKIEFIAA